MDLGHLVSATENQSPIMNRPINGAIGGIMGQGVGSTPPLAINSRRVEYDISMYAVFAVE